MTDTTKNIECPACEKQMKKIYIKDAECCVDICTNGCGGIFFDNREFEKFDESSENIDDIVAELENKDFSKVNDKEIRICPICNIPMVKMGAGIEGVTIDVCNNCGAKFLDNGELEQIRTGKAIDLDKIDILIDKIYSKELSDMLDKNINCRPVTKNLRTAIEKLIYKIIIK